MTPYYYRFTKCGVQVAEADFGLVGQDELVHEGSLSLVTSMVKPFGDDLLKRNALVMLEPLAGGFNVAPLFLGDRLVVDLGGSQGTVERIE